MLTFTIFLGLTIFTFQSKIDFSFMGGALSLGLCVLVVWGIMSALFGWHSHFVYALFGSFLFAGYIVYDTWRLSTVHSYDDYILASIDLYLDIINLFIFLLRLLGDRRD